MTQTVTRLDPISLGVFWDRLIAASEEQVAALLRTSFSPVVRDAGDLASGIFDTVGRMVCQPLTGTPGHINPLSAAVKNFFAAIPPQTLEPGDVLITNDPWLTTGQLLDVTVGVPIFDRQALVAFFACTCHMVDVGGYGPGAGAHDVYEEGVRLPIMYLRRRGIEDAALIRLLRINTRDPEHFLGDLRAMIASCNIGGAKLIRLLKEYGLSSLDDVSNEILERSEQAQRAAISALPDGVFEHGIDIDGFEEPIHLECSLTKRDSEIVIDFAGSSPESGRGINVVLNYTAGYATYAVRSTLAPEVPNNDGSMAPIKVTAPPGCILNCQPPAPTTGRHLVGQFAATPVLGALAQVAPDKVIAEGSGAIWTLEVRGRREGKPYTLFVTVAGGLGARPDKDGLNAVSFPSSIAEVPVEVWENTIPVVIHRKQLRRDSGGPGRWRGGLGQVLEIGMRGGEPWLVNLMTERTRVPAEGYFGGYPGALGELHRIGGGELPTKGRAVLGPADRVVMALPGGGGYGDPLERDPERVEADVRDGFVSREAAERDYAIILTADGQVDVAATEALRASRRRSR